MISYILGILLCLVFSGYFSASEIAFASAKKIRLRTQSELGNKRAKRAYKIIGNFDEALSAILIGNNLVNIAAASISTVLIMQMVGNGATAISTIIMTVFILIFGEITPKILAKQVANEFVLFSAGPLTLLMKILKPLNLLVLFLMRQIHKIWPAPQDAMIFSVARLTTIIDKIENEGIIDEEASELLQSALEFPDISVDEIITPRVDIFMLNLEDSMPEIMEQVLNSPFSRIPVYDKSIDNIQGILHVSNFLKLAAVKMPSKDEFVNLLMEDISINESMKLPKVFRILNQGQSQMAMVVDEYGGVLGCVTIEDLLEELVGDIWDEYDTVEDELVELDPHNYQAKGSVSLRHLVDKLDLYEDYFDSEYNSLAGFLLEQLGRFPESGEKLSYRKLNFKILSVDEHKIELVHIHISEEDEQN